MPFHHSNKRIVLEVGLLLLLGGLLAWGAWQGLSRLASWSAAWVPPSLDAHLGALMAQAVSSTSERCRSAEVQGAVQALTRELENAGALPAAEVTVVVSKEPNAFALPGGHVFVFTGLLEQARSVDEVAGVLAHELGHVAHRHHVQAALREFGLNGALVALWGDLDGLTALVLAQSADLLSLSFGRAQEDEADAFALELLSKTKRSLGALGGFLERLEQAPLVPSLFRTHPLGSERKARLLTLAQTLPVPPRNDSAAQNVTLEALQATCR